MSYLSDVLKLPLVPVSSSFLGAISSSGSVAYTATGPAELLVSAYANSGGGVTVNSVNILATATNNNIIIAMGAGQTVTVATSGAAGAVVSVKRIG